MQRQSEEITLGIINSSYKSVHGEASRRVFDKQQEIQIFWYDYVDSLRNYDLKFISKFLKFNTNKNFTIAI